MSLGRKGSTYLYGLRMEGTNGRGLGGKKWSSKALLTASGEVASGRLGNLGVTLPTANLFAVQIVLGGLVWRQPRMSSNAGLLLL